jgi:two-component system, OmpR family, response regulator CpxR
MRPKKVILCVGADEWRLSLRVYLLKTWGYDVLTAATAKEALAVLSGRVAGGVDLVIAELPIEDFGALVFTQSKLLHPQLHTLVTSDHAGWYDSLGADVLLMKGGDSPAELLARVRILVARKRGPTKARDEEALRAALEFQRETEALRAALDASRGNEKKRITRLIETGAFEQKKPVSRALKPFGSKSKRRVA